MAEVPILVCACGMRLRAPGAVPGRVGKCPRCGGVLRVPGKAPAAPTESPSDPDEPAGGYGLGPAAQPQRPSAYTQTPDRRDASTVERVKSTIWDGPISPPARPETGLRESLLYPLWGANGLALLVFVPPALWITTLPALSLILSQSGGNLVSQTFALLSLLPTILALIPVMGFTLLFLGRVLVLSAIGEVHHPRLPDWDLGEMFRGLGRWVWALVIGGVVGGIPATAYWMYCGDIDLIDGIILTELFAVGAAYGQIALLASILHDDPLGANPVTVLRALYRVRWAALRPSLVIGAAAVLAVGALAGVLMIQTPVLSAIAYWAFWVFVLYESMVVLRVLGLFYHRNARLLGWFRDRPRWGA